MKTRKNISTEATTNNAATEVSKNKTVVVRKPFIIPEPLSKAINSVPSAVIDRLAADNVTEPQLYTDHSEINLLNLSEYHDTIINGVEDLMDQYPDTQETLVYSFVKDTLDNSRGVMNISSEDEPAMRVRINNFNDAMISPSILSMENFRGLEKDDFFNIDDAKNVIYNMLKAKVRSYFRQMITKFILNYNMDITNAVEAYIATANLKGNDISIDPNMVLTTVGNGYHDSINLDDAIALSPIYDIIGRILMNNTNETLIENLNKYAAHADVSTNMCLLSIYDSVEPNVLKNFTKFFNDHIADIEIGVANDLQLIIIDRLAPNVMMLKAPLMHLFNNVLNDINNWYLPMLSDTDKGESKKRRDSEYYNDCYDHPYDYRYRVPVIG